MNTDRWDQISLLFKKALPLSPEDRAALLDEACQDDDEMRHEITSLLQANDESEQTDAIQLALDNVMGAYDVSDISAGDKKTANSDKIGPYKLLRKLGDGGMGAVYLATHIDKPYRKNVALKVLKKGMDSEDVLRRFRNERQILAALNHPNIAELIDGGMTEDGRSYFVMSHVEDGKAINTYCDDLQLPIEKRLRLFQVVCHAVQYAHQNLIVHRDLKPNNILVSKDGIPQLLDFGIAKILNPALFQSTVAVTQTNVRLMTPEYASPEQVRGDAITTATDIYSLGVVLYHLLTGLSPYQFTARTTESIIQVICNHDPEKPSSVLKKDSSTVTQKAGANSDIHQISAARATPMRRLSQQLSGDLDNIVMKALQKEPHRRYSSAGQFAEDIERYLNGQPVIAQRDTVSYRVRKFVSRNKGAVLAAASIFVLLLAFGVAMGIQSARLADERDRTASALAKSESVSEFLMELLKVTDPFKGPDDPDTVEDLLNNGIARIQDLSDQPEVQAQVLDRIGGVLLIRDKIEAARPLLEQALQIRQELFDGNHPELAQSLNSYGLLHHYAGDYEQAELYYRESLAMRDALYNGDHKDTARNLHELGNLLVHRDRHEEAEAILREGIAMRRRLGENHPDLGVLLSDLGALMRISDREEEATPLLKEALALQRDLYKDDNHPEIARTIRQLAIVLRRTRSFDEAERLMRESLALKREIFGEEHKDVANALNSLAVILKDMGRHDEAEALYHEALAMKRRLLGNEHVEVAPELNNLGSLLMSQNRFNEAEPFYLEAYAIYLSKLGKEHRSTIFVRDRLAELYDRWGKPTEAALYREVG